MNIAVIDVGTNSVRLYVADVSGKKQVCKGKFLATTRIGEGISVSNVIGKEPLERTCRQIEEYVQKAQNFNADRIFIYATATVREASNGNEFVGAVKKACGIVPEIISGELEGKIAYMGASNGKDGCAVIDIGGGSTEVVTNINGNFRALSQKTGGVRLKEVFADNGGKIDTVAVKEYVKENFAGKYGEKTDIALAKELVGVSGTPTTLASLSLGLKTYCPEKIQDMFLKREDIVSQTEKMAQMTDRERREYSGEFAPRADIIVYGGCILQAVVEYYGFDGITVSDRDSLEGFAEYKTGIR